ncbi:AfsR/SARP family transcriptional regulator [Streptomyces litchfieldiae]|uniref:BTAD domain-containing putative transcriptional regulator n=1 Tax=Streptomyces litchfieldiae TaxID=3075543 RepID=A0ABU2MXL9_9ACTN|nr:BTAD domain-containing putative transcriptional regulator [Streptomyces sp. DSM 44938]MDT0346018.1 BTAD domain-containing putative transcriptional regulator [Streptomyces sp. DSM 44938]
MRFQVLGSLAILRGGHTERLTGRLERTLLAALLARAGKPVPVEALTDALWGDRTDPRTGQRLQLTVHRLRRKLGEPDRLSFGPAGYRLRVRPGELDAERFESLVGEAVEGARHDPRGAATSLRGALDLWRGTPFAGVDLPALDDWTHRLVERRLMALETLYESELACGRAAEVVAELTTLVREHPLRERLHALLMTALLRAGRPADALAAYRTARDTLEAELGLGPGPELRELERRILMGEPAKGKAAAAEDTERAGARTARSAVPAQLPLNVRAFVGRDAELAELDGMVATTRAAIATVAGTAGVGKTALAVHWAHRVRERFPDGQLYVDLRGYDPDQPVSPGDALGGFLRALGAALPQDPAERTARFRAMTAGRRMLIVLDNARSAEQVRPLLPDSASCFTLITSRDTLAPLGAREDVRPIRLDRLPPADAHRLLRELLGARATAEPAAAEALIGQCVRLPLALRIAAELIRSQPDLSLADLAGELAERQGALDLLDIDGDPYTAVRPVFSWSYQRLDPAAARVFRLLGLHPGHDTDAHAMAALAGHGLPETRGSLDVLLRAHLVDRGADGRYRQHDLLRAYAAELAAATDPAAERESALSRLRGHYLYAASAAMAIFAPNDYAPRPKVPPPDGPRSSFAGYDDALRWLDAERANLLDATRHGDPAFVTRISETVALYLRVRGYFDEAVTLHGRALEAARTIGDQMAEANASRVLGTMMNLSGASPEDVNAHFRRALAAYERVGDQGLQAYVLSSLACVRLRLGELTGALGQFERALALNGVNGNWRVRCAILVNMGRTLRTLGRLDEARNCLESVLELCETHGDKSVEANTHCILADVYTRLGQQAPAFEHARRGMALARETGYRQIEAHCLGKLGTLHRQRGELTQALHLHGENLALARAVGETELLIEALNTLATTHTAAGHAAQALRLHGEALTLATVAGERVAQAHSHAGIAAVHASLDERDAARSHWRQALATYEAVGLPQATDVRARLDELDGRDGE